MVSIIAQLDKKLAQGTYEYQDGRPGGDAGVNKISSLFARLIQGMCRIKIFNRIELPLAAIDKDYIGKIFWISIPALYNFLKRGIIVLLSKCFNFKTTKFISDRACREESGCRIPRESCFENGIYQSNRSFQEFVLGLEAL